MSNRTYLYIKKGMEHVYVKFREIAKREGRSPSEILLELVEGYVRRHEPGNPQKRLDVIMEHGSAKGPVCEKCGAPATRKGFTLGNEVLYLCDVHFPQFKRLIRGFRYIEEGRSQRE